ncbi:MAG: S-adenosylmethionine:tRNA ribosyltransferase-isomerase [Muribaculaceae bacterium]|nr:S-adenosylmethionine:tRNA ribosyltransferase-isomerase [Muribaculaceae bacterium]
MLDKIKNIPISRYDYPLPEARIARHPLAERDSCRLLELDTERKISHRRFSDVADLLRPDSVLVCNDTKVINARIKFQKETGSVIEVFLLEPIAPRDYVLMFQSKGSCAWSCLVGNLKRWKSGPLTKKLLIEGRVVELRARRGESMPGNAHEIMFEWNDPELSFATIVDAAGFIPIPPYLKRESEASDADDYQTVYARLQGSVAAPTAGLHFTPALFDRIRDKGIEIVPVTLHVGAGTFQPVKSDSIGGHPMHTEVFTVTSESVRTIREAMASGRDITAVGTTSVRTLESLPIIGIQMASGDFSLNVGQWEAYEIDEQTCLEDKEWRASTLGALDNLLKYMEDRNLPSLTASTSIMIAPGFRWRIVDNMITNFHQPQSTLLLLVSSFLGEGRPDNGEKELWRQVYEEALCNGYRFLSYGDACFFAGK